MSSTCSSLDRVLATSLPKQFDEAILIFLLIVWENSVVCKTCALDLKNTTFIHSLA